MEVNPNVNCWVCRDDLLVIWIVYQYLQCELVRFTLFKGHVKDGLICRYLPLHGRIAPLEFPQPYASHNHLL